MKSFMMQRCKCNNYTRWIAAKLNSTPNRNKSLSASTIYRDVQHDDAKWFKWKINLCLQINKILFRQMSTSNGLTPALRYPENGDEYTRDVAVILRYRDGIRTHPADTTKARERHHSVPVTASLSLYLSLSLFPVHGSGSDKREVESKRSTWAVNLFGAPPSPGSTPLLRMLMSCRSCRRIYVGTDAPARL